MSGDAMSDLARASQRPGQRLRDQKMGRKTESLVESLVSSANAREVTDRLRRIETRMTAGFEALGVNVKVEKPELQTSGLIIPSLDVRLSDIMRAAPYDKVAYFDVIHKGVRIGQFAYDHYTQGGTAPRA